MTDFIPENFIEIDNDTNKAIADRMILVEGILQEFGANCVGERYGHKIWNLADTYYCVDSFGDNIILEWGETPNTISEDVDPVYYMNPVAEFYNMVMCTLGYDYYITCRQKPMWYKGKKLSDKCIHIGESILASSEHYVVIGNYDNAYLRNNLTGNELFLGSYYGEPQAALIDKNEKFCVVIGEAELCIYFINEKTFKRIECPFEWVYYVIQENASEIKVKIENTPVFCLNVFTVRDKIN